MPPAAEPAVQADLPAPQSPWLCLEFALLLFGTVASAAFGLLTRLAS